MEKVESVTGLRPLEAPQDETAAGSVVPEAGAVGFTSGPWSATCHSDDVGEWFDINSTSTSEYVCNVDHEANARLIAAAPEMYAVILDAFNPARRDSWEAKALAVLAKVNPTTPSQEAPNHQRPLA